MYIIYWIDKFKKYYQRSNELIDLYKSYLYKSSE